METIFGEESKFLKEKNFGLLERLFVWSITFEPLLFFIVASQNITGVGGNISRLLQFIVIVSLFVRTLMTPFHLVRVFNPFNSYFLWYSVYCIFLIVSFIFGYFSGAYEIYQSDVNSSSLINNSLVRPAFEHFITLYYFIYFGVLPIFLLRSKKGINYFFKVFFFMFFLSFLLGIIDLMLVLLTGYEFIPRHLSDFRHVGSRFHGIAGEPRDAFVYLFFGGSLLFLREIWTGIKFNRIWLLLIFVAALLTQSTSGYLGLLMATALIFVYLLPRMSVLSAISLTIVILIGAVVVLTAILSSTRIQIYLDAAPIAFDALESGVELPMVIMYQINNIYPIWLRWLDVLAFNLTPLFIGTGLGTASIANGYILTEGGVLNPHANIIRIFFETGFIGILLYIAAFFQPLRRLSVLIPKPTQILIPMLLMLGVSFGHRSATLFIFFGIALVVFHFKKYALESDGIDIK